MRVGLVLLALSGLAIAAAADARNVRFQNDQSMPGVIRPQQAHVDYMLKCQGCHRIDGSGDAVSNPPMNQKVARFLSVPGGRAFLGRVPGVATVNLDDARLADVLNWMLYRFDRGNLPKEFKPYTASEIAVLRSRPLRTDRASARAALVVQMPGSKL